MTKGHCELVECHADSFSGGGQPGGSAGLDQVMKALGELFGKLMQQKPPSSSSPPPTSPTNPGDSSGCLGTRFPTHDISLISNPCADYTPEPIVITTPTSTEDGSCTILNQALGLCTGSLTDKCPDVPAARCSPGFRVVPGGQDAKGCIRPDTCAIDPTKSTSTPRGDTPTTPATTTRAIVGATTTAGLAVPPGGIRGDIKEGTSGATVVGGSRDTQGNVEVAGFYGSETFGGQGSQGLVGAWCKNRPWATNFLSKVVTPSFFDNICKWRGYQVGAPPAASAPVVVLQQTPKPAASATTTTATSTVTPKVDIWAVPTSVTLGARTSVFWNTQGVTKCTETSPNGGFNQSSLSGGAATQPITAATVFSISCLAPDGTPITDSVTVNLKI
ncbi:hypothetical protein HY971_02645 [Candidatus Kaiserbacteria bacterium]|nr:hypothetical protein [Candidatus Kaiserbacteria bacterium]